MAQPTLVRGSTGSAVETLQTKLNKLGARPELEVDGIFGPLTDGEVKKFQKRLKPPLKPDGKVGTDTWAAIEFELKGGKKPDLKIPDWLSPKELIKYRDHDRKQSKLIQKSIQSAGTAAATFGNTCKSEESGLLTTMKGSEAMWKKVFALQASSEKLVAEFDAGAFRDPARVKVIQSKIDQILAKIEALTAEYPGIERFAAHKDAVKAALNKIRNFKLP
ncbi:MAG: peptidoglycan-binding protein [Ruegeria sp.]|uniref:peptidoglycan-binding domain-containing protein n=1 Tax=Ruegeria sp. TaxID=1879320 RepID=UPI00349E988B